MTDTEQPETAAEDKKAPARGSRRAKTDAVVNPDPVDGIGDD